MKHPLVLSSKISPDKMGSMGFLLSLQETSAFAFIAWCLHSIVGLKFRYADMYDLMTCQPLRPLNPWHSPCPLSPQMRGSPSFGTLFFFPPAGCCWSCSFHLAYMCLPLWLLTFTFSYLFKLAPGKKPVLIFSS